MANKLDLYDTSNLVTAKNIIYQIYAYNYKSESDPLSKKLETMLKKIDKVIETYGGE